MVAKTKSFLVLMIAAWGLLLLSSCDSLSVFVPPSTVPSLDKVSSITLNEQGQLAVSWQAKPNAPASTYQVYLLELPVDDTQYAFTSAALNADPLRIEEIEIAPEEAPRKKGELVNSGRDLEFVFPELLDPGRRYLVQVMEKGRRIKAGDQKVQLVEIQFEPFAATSAAVVDDYVRLNWEPVSGANRYEVYADKEMTVLLASTRASQADIHSENGEFPKEFYVRAFRGLLGAPEPVLITFNQSKVSVIKVESTKPDGKYTIGEKLDFKVTFSGKVNVFGSSFLPLILGEQSREAKYASGNGTDTYLYTYTVQAGDDTERLANGKLLSGEFIDSASLSVSGVLPESGKNVTVAELNAIAIDTIDPTPPMSVGFNTSTSNTGDFSVSWGASQDTYFKQHNLKLCSNAACSAGCNAPQAIAGTTQSFNAITAGIFYACVQGEDTTGLTSDWISSLNPIVIDATAPEIALVYATSADGIYKETQNVIISVEFNENVDVNVGSQVTLKLETGGADREALYTSGSGTRKLDFTYTVQAGDTSGDLNYHSINALSVGTGNIKDFAGNLANLDLPGLASANSLASQSSVIVDTTAPSSPNSIVFPAANSATTSVSMSWSASTDSNFKQHNTKLCLVNDCSTSCTAVTSSLASAVTLNGLDGNTYYGCVQGEDLAGHLSSWVASAATVRIDTSVPTVLQVTSSTPNGTYKEGETLDLLVQFSETVNVTGGSIQLQLETGTTDGSASYLSGSGTDTLTFRYTIQAGDATSDLNYISTTALTLSGGSIKDLTANDADLVLPALADPNSLGSRQAIVIDTEAPTAPTSVAFPANTTSSTTLGFTWGASTDPHFAHYNTKLCSAADCSTACSSVTTASTTSGAGSGVDGSSYYACVQAEDSLGHTSAWIASTAAVAVDTATPAIIKANSSSADGLYKAGDTLDFSIQFSESVLVTNGADLSLLLETGAIDHAATYVSGSGSDTLLFTYTVQAGDTAADLDSQSIGALSKGAAGTIKDAAGNDASLALPALGGANSIAGQKAVILDTTVPSAPSAVGFASSITNNLTFDMSWSDSTDTNFVRHNVKLCTNSDCATGCETPLTSLASPRTMTGVNGSTYYGCVQGEDGAGLTSSWVNSLATITVDATQPTVLSVDSSKANGAYKTGEVIDISVVFSETVVVASPSELKLLLETGATDREASYQSGSNSNTLVFGYTVQAGDDSSDLNYKATNALSVGAGSIQDLAGSNAILTLPALADANSLASHKDLVIDTTAPAAPVITSPADGSFQTSAVTVVSGTSETNATIELKSGSTVIGTTVASGTNWSITLASPLGDGSYILNATATDTATNVSPASADSSFTVDSSAPNPPVIAALTTPTSDQTPTISGTSEAGMTIKVYANGVEVATTTADGSGNWSIDASTLAEDDYLITATATDAGARTSSASADVPLNVDISAPSAPSSVVFPASPKSNSTTLAMTWNDSTDGNFSHHNVKICTASDCSTGCISDGTQLASPASMLGVDLGVYYGCVQGEDVLGHKSAWVASAQTVEIDSTEASVSNVTSSITDGAYTTGASIDIVVTFTKPITVTSGNDLGLLLELGGTDRTASFVSSTGSSITFNYTVQAGDTSADLEYQSTTALTKGASGTIKDAVNTDANLNLPPLGGSSSLAGQKAIIIDTTVPSNPTSVGFASSTTSSTSFNMNWSNSTDTNFSTHNVKICTDSACSVDCTSATTANAGPQAMAGLDGATYYGCVQGKDTAGLLSAWVSSLATITVDATAPTILNVSSSKADGSYKVGETINLLVQFSETVFVDNEGDVKLLMETGTTDRVAPYTTGSGTDTLTFTYTVQAGDSSADLDYQSTSALTIAPSGSIKDVAGSAATLTLPALGGSASVAGQKAIVIDTSVPPAPVIVSPADESYSTTSITTVSGTSEADAHITLKSGSTTIGTTTASGTSWSITLSSALSDGVYSLTAVATDLAGNESPASTANDVTVDTSDPNAPVVATLTTPTLDTTPTISGTSEAGMTIKVYADATLIGTTTADGSGNWSVDSSVLSDAGYSITATATDPGSRTSAASNAVPLNVDTTNPSAPAGVAFSAATSTSTSLSFSWTDSTDVNFQTHNIKICTDSACSIGCLGDTTANASPATLTGANGVSYYACVQGQDSLLHTSAWVASAATARIDTTIPTVTGVSASTADGYYKTGEVIDITVGFSEDVDVETPTELALLLETGTTDRSAVYSSGSGTSTLVFQYTVQATDTSDDLNYASTVALTAGAGSIKDLAGNAANLALPALGAATSLATQKALVVDTTAPSAPSSITFAGATSNTLSFDVNWSASTDTNFSTHNVKICTANDCNTGCISATTSTASPASVTGVDANTYYACVQGQDLAGLTSSWVASASSILVDASAPSVLSVSSTQADGSYKAGVSIPITIQFSEIVLVANPSDLGLLLETGTTDRTAVYASGSGSDTLVFNYLIQAGDTSSDLEYKATTSLTKGATGTIKDASNNDAGLTLPALGGTGSLANQKALIIDTTAPAAPIITTPANNAYSTTDVTTISGTSETGASIAIIQGGSTIGTATASGTSWTVTLSSALTDGSHTITATATDAAGNVSVASTANTFVVDTSAPNAPVITTVTSPTLDTTPPVSGTSEANMAIEVFANGSSVGTTTADASGNWTLSLNALTEGTYTLTAKATDPGARVSSASAGVTQKIDTSNPTAPSNIVFTSAYSTSTSLGFSWTNSTDLNFQTHNIKLCTNSACSVGCIGETTTTASPATIAGVNGTSYYACVQGVDAVEHTSAWIASAATGTVDTTLPTVTSVSASTADGYYKTGDVIAVTVTFSEIVNVTTPAQLGLQLKTGATDRIAAYNTGTGSATLTFHYTVEAGDVSADLNYLATSSLTVGSGAIKDAAGNDATLTLPGLASANSLATQKAIVIDTTAPSDPTSVGFAGSTTNSPTFNVSWSASTDSNFSTHNVKLCTNTGCSAGCTTATTSVASPASVTGLDGTTYYGCIQGQDLAGLKSNWVNSASTILIDASAPTVVSVSSTQADGSYKAGVTIPITVQFSETVVVANEADLYLILETGTTDRNATYVAGHNSNTLTFNYVVQSGDVSSDLNYVSTSSLKLGASGTIKDLSGNAATLTLPAVANANSLGTQKAIVIDTAAPAVPVITTPANGAYSTTNVTTISGTSESGASIAIIKGGSTIGTATASGTSWTVTLGSALTDGSHTITATATDAAGNVSVASTANTFTVDTSPPTAPVITTYTSPTNDTTPAVSGTSEAGMTINLFANGSAAGSTTADGSGNWSLSLNTLAEGTYTITAKATDPGSRVSAASTGVSMTIDTTPPTVSNVTSTSSDATYGPGNSIIIRVNFSENVYTTGTPQIQLEAGASDPQATYISGSSGSSLYFTFTVATGHTTSDLDYVGTSSLTGTIKDAAGNSATLTLPTPGAANSLGANKAIVLDGIAPTVTNITSTKANTMYGPNAVIDIQVTFSETVYVLGGTPTLSLNTTPSRSASYASGSTTNTLTFNYTVQTNDVQADLNATALVLNGATIRDWASNNTSLTVPASQATGSLNLNKNIQIAGDSVAPVLTATPSSQNKFTGAAITSVNVDTTIGNDKDADNTAVTYTCRYDTTNNSAMDAGGTDCASLPNTAYSFSSTTGVLTWTPSAAAALSQSAPTTYEFQVVGTDPTLISGSIFFTVNVLKAFTTTIGFDAGDSANYSYSSTSIDYSGGYARLLASDQIDDDGTSTGFGGTLGDSGTTLVGGAVTLGDSGGCDGLMTNCYNVGSDWTPQKSTKVSTYYFDSNTTGWNIGNTTVAIAPTQRKMGLGSVYMDGTQSHLWRAQEANNSFTYNFWIKTTQSFTNGNDCTAFFNGAGIVTAESGGVVNDWGVHMCDGYILAGVGNPDTTIPSYYRVNDNVWHMITFTRNKTNGVFALYVDGDLQGTATGNTNTLNANANYNIGAVRPDGAKWQGYLDDLVIWSTVLTTDEIQRIYDRLSSKFSGVFVSRVMDATYTAAPWTSLSWKPTLPFGKELPDYSGGIQNESTTDYLLGSNTLMNNIFALWHLNETASGTIFDDSGNSKNGTISTNTGMGQVGRFGKAINPWDSSGIPLGAAANYAFGTSSLSFSAWFKTQQASGRIFSTQIWQYNGVLLETSDGNIKFDVGCADGPEANCISVRTNGSKFNDGAWHHSAVVWDRSANKIRIYVDGFQQSLAIVGSHCGSVASKELNTSSCTSVNANASENAAIGARSDGSWVFYGLLDEIAIWKRALSFSDVTNLYRRGANRLLFQVRTCANASCSGNAFHGPDNTGQTFFTEFNNNTTPLTGTGTVKAGLPTMTFTDFGYTMPANRYLQYRVFMESDDSIKLCSAGTASCTPDLIGVTLGNDHFPTSNPPITYTVSIPYYTIASFAESVTCAAGIKYQISRDNSTWYYHNGTTWVASDGTYAKSSTAAAINTNAATFATVVGRTSLYVRTLLPSNGTQSCEINSITVTGNSAY